MDSWASASTDGLVFGWTRWASSAARQRRPWAGSRECRRRLARRGRSATLREKHARETHPPRPPSKPGAAPPEPPEKHRYKPWAGSRECRRRLARRGRSATVREKLARETHPPRPPSKPGAAPPEPPAKLRHRPH